MYTYAYNMSGIRIAMCVQYKSIVYEHNIYKMIVGSELRVL